MAIGMAIIRLRPGEPYTPPRHPDDDNPDGPLGEYAPLGLEMAGEYMRDLAQLIEDLAGHHIGGSNRDRRDEAVLRVGSLNFIAASLREMGARCGETYHAEVLNLRAPKRDDAS